MKTELQSIEFTNKVWQLVFSDKGEILVETRSEVTRSIAYFILNKGFESNPLSIRPDNWMNKILSFDSEKIIFQSFEDTNDPNHYHFIDYHIKSGEKVKHSILPDLRSHVVNPSLFNSGSDNFRLAKQLVNKDLVGIVEYWEDHETIAISYYLNNIHKLDHYLMVIKGGQTQNILQDQEMSGVSPDAFCIFGNQIVFIKDANKVCRISI